MAALVRSKKSGEYTARKGIPKDVREAYLPRHSALGCGTVNFFPALSRFEGLPAAHAVGGAREGQGAVQGASSAGWEAGSASYMKRRSRWLMAVLE